MLIKEIARLSPPSQICDVVFTEPWLSPFCDRFLRVLPPYLMTKGRSFRVEDTLNNRQRKEQAKLKKIYKNLSKEHLEIAKKLIERAAYMLVSLEDMEAKINEDGLVVKMPQGNYEIERAHPLLQPYNAMVKNYNTIIKQLSELLPSSESATAGQALMMFATKPNQAAKKH